VAVASLRCPIKDHASRLSHRFAFSPPSIASAYRGFLPARPRCSCSPCGLHLPATLDASEPTSATLHTRLRALVPRGFPAQSQGCLFPALTWGTRRFTTPRPLRRALRLCFVGGVFFPVIFHEPVRRTSDIPVAFPQPRCASLIRTDPAKLPEIAKTACP